MSIVFLILFVVIAALRQQGTSQLAQAMQEARKLGGPVTLEEVLAARQVPPDERNGASAVTALKPALDALKPYPKEAPIVGDAYPPPLGHRWSQQQIDAARAALERTAAQLAELDQLLVLEKGVFPVSLTANPSDLVQSQIPFFGLIRTCVKLKSLQTIARIVEGDGSRLAADFEVLYRLSEIVNRSPLLVGRLTGMACEALAIEIVEECCALQILDPTVLARVEQVISRSEQCNWMAKTMRGERAYSIAMFDYLRTGQNLTGWAALRALPDAVFNLLGGMGRDEAASIRLYNKLLSGLEAGRLLETITSVETGLDSVSRLAIITHISFPSHLRWVTLELRYLSQNRAARVALAAERYRLATGAFPKRLEELVPTYIDAIPEDPFNPGEPIKMAVRDDRVIFYGVGEDRTDDGGDVEYKRSSGIQPKDSGFTLLVPPARNQPPIEKPASRPTTEAENVD